MSRRHCCAPLRRWRRAALHPAAASRRRPKPRLRCRRVRLRHPQRLCDDHGRGGRHRQCRRAGGERCHRRGRTNLKAPGITVIDGQGMIVLPVWWRPIGTCGTRCCAACRATSLISAISAPPPCLGQKFLADDMYQGTRLACAEAINNGITHGPRLVPQYRGPNMPTPTSRRCASRVCVRGSPMAPRRACRTPRASILPI